MTQLENEIRTNNQRTKIKMDNAHHLWSTKNNY